MSVKTRIDRLERATGGNGGGYCECAGSGSTTWPDGEPVRNFVTGEVPEVKPDVCAKCGRPVRVVVLTWDDDPRDWEANPAVRGVVAIGGIDLEADI